MKKNRSILLLDLDGVLLGMTGYHTRNAHEFAEAILILNKWQEIGGEIFIATNRTPAEMQPIAYMLGLKSGYWITENGGTIYDVATGHVYVTKNMEIYANIYVPELRKFIKNYPSISLHYLSGRIRTLLELDPGLDTSKYITTVLEPIFQNFKFNSHFSINMGKIISIDPVNLDKTLALEHFFSKNKIEMEDLIFYIGDADRDIGIARKLGDNNVVIGAVGNSTLNFHTYVVNLPNGTTAPPSTNHHSSLVFIMQEFITRLTKYA